MSSVKEAGVRWSLFIKRKRRLNSDWFVLDLSGWKVMS